jgi:hypothetical protein
VEQLYIIDQKYRLNIFEYRWNPDSNEYYLFNPYSIFFYVYLVLLAVDVAIEVSSKILQVLHVKLAKSQAIILK